MSQSMTPNLGWTGSFPGFPNLSREPSTVIPTNFNTFDKTETKQKDNKSDIKEKREREEKERKDKERKDKEDKDKWEKEEKKERLDKIRKFTQDWKDLRHCFEDISDFCINKYSKRYDPTNPIGKPVHNRQEFLREQKFLEVTLLFLDRGFETFMKADAKFSEDKTSKKILDPLNMKKVFDSEDDRLLSIEKEEEELLNSLFTELDKCIKKSFEFIFSLCRRNIENRKYVFENRYKFVEYLLKYKEAAKCLIDIIMNFHNN